MLVKIEMVEQEIKQAICNYITATYGVAVDPSRLEIEVKSKQNYRSEWESAAIRINASCSAVER